MNPHDAARATHTWGHDASFRRYVKIVATLGPAIADREIMHQVIDAGIDMVRINCSHGTPEGRLEMIRTAREIAAERHQPLPVLMDLQGLKLRTGQLEGAEPAMLAQGARVDVYPTAVTTTPTRIGVLYPNLLSVIRRGQRILLADGLIELLVEQVLDDHAVCSIGRGGPLASRQGVTLPNVVLQDGLLTENDQRDIQFAAEHQIEYIGLSFISSVDDVVRVREFAGRYGWRPGIVAKIERPSALAQIEAIAEEADVVMVARGDLGVQLPPEQVPRAQKEIVAVCNRLGTPVITATQMLESMIMQPVPTRAETSDVANAVLDGTDAVMLSAETATGRYPVEAVQMMDRIIREVERYGPVRGSQFAVTHVNPQTDRHIVNALGMAARALADAAPISHIIVFTLTGASARLVAKERPRVPIIALTTDPFVARQLAVVWGIRSIVSPLIDDVEELLNSASRQVIDAGLAYEGAEALFVGSLPVYRVSGRTNLLHIRKLERDPLSAHLQIDQQSSVPAD